MNIAISRNGKIAITTESYSESYALYGILKNKTIEGMINSFIFDFGDTDIDLSECPILKYALTKTKENP